MSIVLTTPPQSEPLDYKYVYMTSILITQPINSNDNSNPMYNLEIKYKLFAVGNGSKRYFESGEYSVTVPNYFNAAVAQAGLGDNTMITAIASIEAAVSKAINDKNTHGNVSIGVAP